MLYQPLADIDPQVKNIIDKETWRQFTGLELIASEVGICFLKNFVVIFESHKIVELDESGCDGG